MKEIFIIETAYMLMIVLFSLYIFVRVRMLYDFSKHKLLRYLSTAFLFFAIAFVLRYVTILMQLFAGDFSTISRFNFLTGGMEFFMVLPGFYLLYSLVWKRFEQQHTYKKISLQETFFYVLALAIALGDYLMSQFILMYSSQILVFAIASFISFRKYKRQKNTNLQRYFWTMLLFCIVWIINLIAQYTIGAIPQARIVTYVLTIAATITFVYLIKGLLRES